VKIALVAKRGSAQAAELAREIRARLPEATIVAERGLAEALGWLVPASAEEVTEGADLLVVLGGDGTFIHGARLLRGRSVPILGVNLGSLGFLTEIPVVELFAALEDVMAGRAKVDHRMKLACRVFRAGKVLLEDEVLNDVVINKGALARIADHECHIDGAYVTTYKSDGVVISTPTGSTAYALSAGGPIVQPAVECALIAPICPHALTQRPLVLPAESVISILLKSETADVFLTIDGQAGHALETGDRLEVRRAEHRVPIIRNRRLDYYAILRQKLHWGER
jgi:NAD+ kinase